MPTTEGNSAGIANAVGAGIGRLPSREGRGTATHRAVLAMASATLLVVVAAPATTVAQQRVETHGSNSPVQIAGRDAIIQNGYTAVEIQQLVATAVGAVVADAARASQELATLSRRLGVTEGAALAMLRALGRLDVQLENLPDALGEVAKTHLELLERLRRLDDGDPEVTRLGALAREATEEGDYDEADRLLSRAEAVVLEALQRERERLDRSSLAAADVLASRAELTQLRVGQGTISITVAARESAQFYIRAAELLPERFASRTAAYLREAAGSLMLAGDFARSERLFRRAVEICERGLGPDHPDTAAAYTAFADWLMEARGKFAEAEGLYRRALSVRERTLGAEHPDTAATLGDLAVVQLRLGRLPEGLELARRSMAIREHSPEPRTPGETIDAVTPHLVLGLALVENRRPADAEEIFRRALALLERGLGRGHPVSALPSLGYGRALLDKGDLYQAEAVLRDALAVIERQFGPGNPYVGHALQVLGETLRRAGKMEEALEVQRQALAICEAAFGADHPGVAFVLNNLAASLFFLGRAAEAEPLLRRAVAILEAALGPEHASTRTMRANLSAVGARPSATQTTPPHPATPP